MWHGSLLASLEGGETAEQVVGGSIPRKKIFSLGCEGENYREFFCPLWGRFEAPCVWSVGGFGWSRVLLRLNVWARCTWRGEVGEEEGLATTGGAFPSGCRASVPFRSVRLVGGWVRLVARVASVECLGKRR